MKNPVVEKNLREKLKDFPEGAREALVKGLPEVNTTHVCGECGYSIHIPEDYPGMWVLCPSCGHCA